MSDRTVDAPGASDASRVTGRGHGSVFAKLVAIMVVLAASLLGIVGLFFWLIVSPNLNESVDRIVREYAHLIASHGPGLEEARRVGARHDIDVRYEGPDGAWTTSDALPTIQELQARRPTWLGRFFAVRAYYIVPSPTGGSYLVAWNMHRRLHAVHQQLLALLLILMAGVVLVAHLVLRHLLRPLRALGEGVGRLSGGELDVVVETRTRDEFGALTRAFNQMVGRVREMIRARDQLLRDVSHELRSPLTRLKVALALLPEDDRRAQMSADVAEMEAMIAELLELERLRDGGGLRPTPTDLVPVLHEVAAAYAGQPPGVRVVSAGRQIVATVDPDKIRVVLRNLVENGVKYSLPDSRPVDLDATRAEDRVVIRVTDDGPGIPEADIPNLFEPFYRVDRSRSKKTGGYGLGLSICKRIVEAHGGTIAAENNPGRGATFVMTLPSRAVSIE